MFQKFGISVNKGGRWNPHKNVLHYLARFKNYIVVSVKKKESASQNEDPAGNCSLSSSKHHWFSPCECREAEWMAGAKLNVGFPHI